MVDPVNKNRARELRTFSGSSTEPGEEQGLDLTLQFSSAKVGVQGSTGETLADYLLGELGEAGGFNLNILRLPETQLDSASLLIHSLWAIVDSLRLVRPNTEEAHFRTDLPGKNNWIHFHVQNTAGNNHTNFSGGQDALQGVHPMDLVHHFSLALTSKSSTRVRLSAQFQVLDDKVPAAQVIPETVKLIGQVIGYLWSPLKREYPSHVPDYPGGD